jgi:hypothetical protein
MGTDAGSANQLLCLADLNFNLMAQALEQT